MSLQSQSGLSQLYPWRTSYILGFRHVITKYYMLLIFLSNMYSDPRNLFFLWKQDESRIKSIDVHLILSNNGWTYCYGIAAYQWMVMLWGDLLMTWTVTESPSLTSMVGPGSCPFTTMTGVSLQRRVIFVWFTYMCIRWSKTKHKCVEHGAWIFSGITQNFPPLQKWRRNACNR